MPAGSRMLDQPREFAEFMRIFSFIVTSWVPSHLACYPNESFRLRGAGEKSCDEIVHVILPRNHHLQNARVGLTKRDRDDFHEESSGNGS
jgi:hypothetical protein